MTEPQPNACSLDADDLQRRLASIAAVATASLIEHRADGGRHRLRFRPDPGTRGELEAIVAAESECCPFLELGLERAADDLVLTIAAPRGAQATADQLAAAFTQAPT